MKKTLILGAAAIFATVAAMPSSTLAACALYDPGCATYPMPKNVGATVRAESPALRTARVERRATVRERHYTAAVAREPVGAAAAVTAGAVATAGAIATAPFRAADSYAYYNEGYNGWDHRTYAERNGFVCTPGELFKGFDGRVHVCQ